MTEKEQESESEYEAVKADVLGSASAKDKAIYENVCLLIEAQAMDTDEAVSAVYDEAMTLKLAHAKSIAKHALKIVAGYAGFSVSLGIHTKTIDDDGEPTPEMPQKLIEALQNLNENFAALRDQCEELFADEPAEPVVVEPDAGTSNG